MLSKTRNATSQQNPTFFITLQVQNQIGLLAAIVKPILLLTAECDATSQAGEVGSHATQPPPHPLPPHSLHWRHNDHDGFSNHQPHGCLLNRLFGRSSKKTSKLGVTGLCAGNSPGPVNSPHKGPVTRKMFPFDDVIMLFTASLGHLIKRFRCCHWKHCPSCLPFPLPLC